MSVVRTLDCQSGTASDLRQSFQDLTDRVMQILIRKLLDQETAFDFEQFGVEKIKRVPVMSTSPHRPNLFLAGQNELPTSALNSDFLVCFIIGRIIFETIL